MSHGRKEITAVLFLFALPKVSTLERHLDELQWPGDQIGNTL